MVSTTLLLLLVSCAARDLTLRPLVELAPAPARALPFQTEEEAWRVLLSQGGLPPPKVAPVLLLDDRIPAPGHLSELVFAPRFLGDADDARAVMGRWTTRWAGRPVALEGLSDEGLVEGVAAWALVGLARELAMATATEGWTLRRDELIPEAMMATQAGIYALDSLITSGRVPPSWRASYAALLTAVLAETSAPVAANIPIDEAAAWLNQGEELRQALGTSVVLGFGEAALNDNERAALYEATRTLLASETALLTTSGPSALPESLTTRLAERPQRTVERSLGNFDPPLQSWERSAEGVIVGAVNDRGWMFRLDVEGDRVRAVLTVPMPKNPALERDLMALANAVNGALDSAHLDLMPGELRLRHAWTPITSDSTAADALNALVTVADRWAPLFEQVATKALTVEQAWTVGQGDAP
ncbi:MAG: hypothetical protein RIT28_5025 [Pseudomonadota bacterium]